MSDVTITITVSTEDGTVTVGGGEGAPSTVVPTTGDAASPTLGASDTLDAAPLDSESAGAPEEAGYEAGDLEGPPPLDLAELGVSAPATEGAAPIGDAAEPEDLDESDAGADAAASDADDEAQPVDVGEP